MPRELFAWIDHLVYATPDVDQTMHDLSELFGVTAIKGGQHPQWGTRNALLSLGPQMYLEIMGPDASLSDPKMKRPFDIDKLHRPRLAAWVCRSADLEKTVTVAKQAGVDLGTVQSGKRSRPDGGVLSWTMTDLMTNRENGIVPYFINWGRSVHPARNAPSGCTLRDLRAEHPNPNHIVSIFRVLDLDLRVDYGKGTALIAAFTTPKGLVELS
jgi:hypothetical protein